MWVREKSVKVPWSSRGSRGNTTRPEQDHSHYSDGTANECVKIVMFPRNGQSARQVLWEVNWPDPTTSTTPQYQDNLVWGCDQAWAFTDVKVELAKPTVLTPYNPLVQTKVSADASSYGLGAMLMQKSGAFWKPVAYASRSVTNTEQRYAQIEKEALATVWACEKFAPKIIGLKFLIETDHRPLVPLLGYHTADIHKQYICNSVPCWTRWSSSRPSKLRKR